MTYKLVAIDIDDTMVTSDQKIPDRVAQAIQKAVDSGVHVVLSTGRLKKGAIQFYDALSLDTLLISAGGAEVHNAAGDALFMRTLDPRLAKQVLSYAYDNGVHPQAYIDGELVYKEKNKYTDEYEAAYGSCGTVTPHIMDIDPLHTPKVLLIIDEDKIDAFSERAKVQFPMLAVQKSKPNYLEFGDPTVNKGTALKFVADYYDVKREEIIAIGDTEIDIPMLEYAGLGVAVANAKPNVKKAADIVCASNVQAGVADIIDKYILEA